MIQLVSPTELVFQVLMSRRHVVHQDSTTLAYQVERFLSLPLDPLVTLSSSSFTRGKIASECDVTFEWYRIYEPGFNTDKYSTQMFNTLKLCSIGKCIAGVHWLRYFKNILTSEDLSLLRPSWNHSNRGELLFHVIVVNLCSWPNLKKRDNRKHMLTNYPRCKI